MNALPASIDRAATASAPLPQTYETAKTALAQCARLDECQDWADKAAALASYARQAHDDQLEKMAVRIRARAVRRCGELLKQFDAKGRNQHTEDSRDAPTKPSRREVAERAGLSKDQQVTAVRVANVSEPEFTRQVESENPPTITKLAEQGVKPQVSKAPIFDLKGRDPREFNQAMHYIGPISRYAREVAELNHDFVLPILTDRERNDLRAAIAEIDAVHDMIATRI